MQRITVNKTTSHIGKEVKVAGWVHVRRDHGKLIFIDLRDSSGLLQIVFNNDFSDYSLAEELRPEWVVEIVGEVVERPENMVNKDIATGKVELKAKELHILNKAKTPPFDVTTDGKEIGEENRLKYRYLDLRRERMQRNLDTRSKVLQFFRNHLHKKGFIEIETPYISKSTPEGARDYVVPSRKHHGKFYALPQSPQQYKQLLMVGGIEKYFQLARAFRDEDTRGDRQPEHTQLDIEMSFTSSEEVMSLVEEMTIKMMREIFPEKKMKTPWPRITHEEAMEKYKTDKPDLRENKDDPNEIAFAWVVEWPYFSRDKETGRLNPIHHMFVQPKEEDIALLDSAPLKVESTQYDWVCNGYELASGSMRINDSALQTKIFELLEMNKEDIESNFGHILKAFRSGAPPHGGIAPGMDRLLMILLGEPNIREVIAFPKTGDGRDLMMNSPSEISEQQLNELGIEIKKKKKKK